MFSHGYEFILSILIQPILSSDLSLYLTSRIYSWVVVRIQPLGVRAPHYETGPMAEVRSVIGVSRLLDSIMWDVVCVFFRGAVFFFFFLK